MADLFVYYSEYIFVILGVTLVTAVVSEVFYRSKKGKRVKKYLIMLAVLGALGAMYHVKPTSQQIANAQPSGSSQGVLEGQMQPSGDWGEDSYTVAQYLQPVDYNNNQVTLHESFLRR